MPRREPELPGVRLGRKGIAVETKSAHERERPQPIGLRHDLADQRARISAPRCDEHLHPRPQPADRVRERRLLEEPRHGAGSIIARKQSLNMTTPPCVANRIALITGAGRGIGRAIALMLGRAGTGLVLTARTRSELDVVAHEILSTGGRRPLVHDMDLTVVDAVVAGLAALQANVPRIDI